MAAVNDRGIEGRLREAELHVIPSWVEGTQPHKSRRREPSARGAANADCLKCHSNRDLTMERDGEVVSLFVNEEVYALSKHGETACAQCHDETAPRDHNNF